MSVVAELQRVDWSGREVLVACSGGVDSMVLLHALCAIGVKPAVLHVNYQLRGSESDADEQLVAAAAKKCGLPFTAYACPPERLKTAGTNLQAEARAFRRELFAEWTNRSAQHVVALAHHADDQLETFFLQLLRGSGTFGLGGMHPERRQLVRPFLDLPKADLYHYAKTHAIAWREDRSNAENAYLRNRFRNELIPAIETQVPAIRESVRILMQAFRQEQQELIASVEEVIAAWNAAALNATDWQVLTAEQKLAFVYAVDIPVWAIERFDKLAASGPGKQFAIGDLTVWKSTASVMRIRKRTHFSDWDYKIEETGILPEEFDRHTLYLDAEKVDGELEFRAYRTGDRIRSVGMEGSQRVSEVLKDAGIPRENRQEIPILADNSAVLWIPGIKVGKTALADAGTQRILVVRLVERM